MERKAEKDGLMMITLKGRKLKGEGRKKEEEREVVREENGENGKGKTVREVER